MEKNENKHTEEFNFRRFEPEIGFGTASDRYASWIGQIYSTGKYDGKITRRKKKLGKESFTEQVLPIESVEEYFRHFSLLEIDFTFYRPLMDKNGKPTSNFFVLKNYVKHLNEGDGLIIKVPQAVCAQSLRRGAKMVKNPDYLNAEIFKERFYDPVMRICGANVQGFIFEQEYQRKKDRKPVKLFVEELQSFFGSIPGDGRYHLEIRTEALLTQSYFRFLEENGIGQVFSHWTWLPPLAEQFEKSGNRFLNRSKSAIIRLMTPQGMNYAQTYAKAFPFDRMIDDMLSRRMLEDTRDLIETARKNEVKTNVIINNRAGGNAPLIAVEIAKLLDG